VSNKTIEGYRVTVWDKQANAPYMFLDYGEEELAKQVARNMKKHYIDDWGKHAESFYEVRLHKMMKESQDG